MTKVPVPPSQRVEAALRARLDAGEWAPGAPLPPLLALAQQYGTSPATVRKAVHRLADEGLLTVVPSWGIFAA